MNEIDTLFQARYGDPAARAPEAHSELIAHLLSHRSVRAYKPDPVSDAQLTAIIAAAQSAATSSNLHAWSVIAVRDAERKAALAEYAGGQAHVRDAPLQLVWLADLSRLHRVATACERPDEALDYTEMFLVAAIDAALAAQNAAAAAESLGLSLVYIGGMRNRPEEVAHLLGLPPRVFAVFGMCLGYEDTERPAAIKPRPPQAVVLHHETYSVEQQAAPLASYDETMARFYEGQGMNVRGSWSIHSAKRVAGPASLTGRDRLVEALRKLGFPLK